MKKERKQLVKKSDAKTSDFFEGIKKTMSSESLGKAKTKALNQMFLISLSELRERQGRNQSDLKGFTQTGVSKLESREDMKLSTIIQYLQAIDMDMEIIAKPKGGPAIKLLKTG